MVFSHQGYVNAEAHHGGKTCNLDLLDAYSAGEEESSFFESVAGGFGGMELVGLAMI